MRTLRFALLPLLLVACEQQPAAPEVDAVPSFSATTTWTDATLFIDFINTNGVNTCVGENWHAYGVVPYRMHEVSNAAGGYSYHAQLLPVTPRGGPRLSLTGLISGTVWWLKNGQSNNESFHLGKGQVYRYKFHETYQSDDGSRLFNDGWMHLTVNANGELVVARIEYLGVRCDKRN